MRPLTLLAVLIALALPAAASPGGSLSLLWSDRPVCLLLADCSDQWRVRLRYEIEWQPPVAHTPLLFLDGDVLLKSGSRNVAHFTPLHGWFGGGVRWRFNGLSLAVGGTSGHYFDRDGTERKDLLTGPSYNYGELRWTW